MGYTVAGVPKTVRYWLLEAANGRFLPNSEADEGKWLDPAAAAEVLTYERDRNLVGAAARLLDEPRAGRVHLVRHGHAGTRHGWSGPDEERPLTDRGFEEARAIVGHLLEHPVTRIDSSTYVRCEQTVRGLADALDLEVRDEPALTEGAPPEDALTFIAGLGGQSAVLCSHGDIVSGVIGELAADGVPLAGDLEWKKGSIWELDIEGDRVTSGRYLPPPALWAHITAEPSAPPPADHP